ncbi:MAG: vanadium-dependent haloperoxidase [Saprospiraceae bacterium]|nr:vanadium-dependent haloperoxidase [Candidatus Vicinibacter affinis]MBP6172760.1 vanadium-dependent haloperoxidase [Saprospiraceae bacterium]
MKSNFIKLGALLLFVVLMMPSCRKSETQTEFNNAASFDYKVVHSWNELFLNIDKDALGFRPGPGPRALAYMSIAAYEVCVPGMPKYNSLKNLPNFQGAKIPELTGSKDLHYPSAVNAAYAFLMSKMFEKVSFFQSGTGSHIANNAEAQQMIENLRLSLENEYKSQINNTKYINSKAWGEDVARAIWEWSTTDKIGHEAYLNPLSNDPTKTPYHNWKEKSLDASGNRIPGKWAPTNDNPDGGMFPFWGQVRTFATNNSQKISRPPLPYSEAKSSQWYANNLEVYAATTPKASYEDEWVAEFWSDDLFGLTFAPPPRMVAVMDQVFVKQNSTLEEAVYANALMGITLNDCAVVCWNSKWYYNTERPEHFIKDQIDPSWESQLDHPYTGQKGVTPAFPAYPSGHSTFGGGGAFALAAVWGDHYTLTDRCHENRTEFIGSPRTFYNFSDLGLEDALSRIPLGVHIRIDCVEGVRLGREVGARVSALPWRK